MPPRDFQRQRVYRAGSAVRPYRESGFMSLDEAKGFVESVTGSAWWRNRTLPRNWTVRVKDGRGRRSACGSHMLSYIKLPRWTREKNVILHELAHVATNPDKVSAHGREFCGWYLALVRQFLGEHQYKRLRQSMKDHGVKVGPMPKPIWQVRPDGKGSPGMLKEGIDGPYQLRYKEQV